MSGRSPEDREAARLEREARRAAERGDSVVPEPADDPVPEEPAAFEPEVWMEEEPAAEPELVEDDEPFEDWVEPAPGTQRGWDAIAGIPDRVPPPVRRVPRGTDPHPDEATQPFTGEPPVPGPPAPRIGPPPSFDPASRRRGRGWGGRAARGADRREATGPAPQPTAPPTTAPGPAKGRKARKQAASFDTRPPDRRPPRLERSPRRRRPFRLLAALLVLAVVAVAAWFLVSLFQPFHGDGGAPVTVTIPEGDTASDVGDLLAAEGVVAHGFFFSLRARLEGKRDSLKAGTFTLKRDMSYDAAIDTLSHNPPVPPVIKLTIPEGLARGDIAALAGKAGVKGDYDAASGHSNPLLHPHSYGAPARTTNLEGFLFPATYELKRSTATASQLVDQQLIAFKENFSGVDLGYAKKKNLTAYDVLTIASMIEREAAVAKDRPLIAAVIYNRLHEHIPLGIDATLRYELRDWTSPLTNAQLAKDTPFNTRLHLGLPPTPIGNPGMASIQAAAHPAHVSYLYYVVKPCGHGAHAFSSTKAKFDQDVAAYNAAREKAGGKSPVDC